MNVKNEMMPPFYSSTLPFSGIKAVLIDIDDTLLSFSGYVKQTMKDGFAQYDLGKYNDEMYLIFKKINNELWKQIEQGTLSFNELQRIRWNRIFKELRIDFDGEVFEKFFRDSLHNSAIVEPGAVELLQYLGEKYILCTASNGPYEQQINRLKVGNLYDYFDYFFISEKIGVQKPSMAFFDYCIGCIKEKSNIDILPNEIVIIGDSISADIIGAKQYGLSTCLYSNNKELPEMGAEADYIVETLAEIKQIL